MGRTKGYKTDKRLEIEDDVIKEFNRKELKEGETVIDNRDSTLAKMFNVKVALINLILNDYLNKKIQKVIHENDLIREREERAKQQLKIKYNKLKL